VDFEVKSVSNIIVLLSIIIVFANPLPAQNLEEKNRLPVNHSIYKNI